jgi:phenylacetaldehyde dehydrogenase
MTSVVTVNGEVARFIAEPPGLLIGGEWSPSFSGRTFETYDPATGLVLADVPDGEAPDIDRAVRAARAALEPWRAMTPSDRGRLLHRIGDAILADADELALIETLDNGKPRTVARSVDVPLAADLFHYMAGWATKLSGETITPSVPRAEFHAYSLLEPIGVVGAIVPWNFPLLMAAWKLGPALAAGCTVVLKPAELTPLSALRLGELCLAAGLPAGVLNIITGYGETAGAALAAHPDVDKIAFTGSAEVGRLILGAATNDLKKVSLELGGKNPNIIFADADLDAAILGSVDAAFFNTGQACGAGSRLYAHRSIFGEVLTSVALAAERIKVGPGLEDDTQIGPLISADQLARVSGYLTSGLRDGAHVVSGGERILEPGYFLQPTVLAGAVEGTAVMREEIFGPVVCVVPFDTEDEVIAAANATDYGLAAGVWTSDLSRAHRMARRLQAGTVWINCYLINDAALPFGGYKQSGWGREMGRQALELYTETKSVCIRI